MELGEILKELRNNKGLTQASLAEQIGFSKSIIGFWESGKHEPTASALVEIASFFDVSTDYLVGLENEDGSKIPCSLRSFTKNRQK
ncbi:MAG: helix-turn-helix domain-containing protein [Firmicutes bacterium]|nr:helix-turn-helix domain-containing protein [Bacillota bacterium]